MSNNTVQQEFIGERVDYGDHILIFNDKKKGNIIREIGTKIKFASNNLWDR